MPTRSGVSQRTGNPWASREYILEIPGQYPKHMVFTVFGEDRIKQFALRKDEEVTIHFDIDANEYQGKWYNKILAYNVTRSGQQVAQQAVAQPSQATAQPQPTANTEQKPFPSAQQGQGDSSEDDLPFD